MIRQRNPLDPLDDVKRWYADLWPLQRWGFWTAVTVAVLLLLLLVTR